MEKNTSVLGFPTDSRLVEKAAEILGACQSCGLSFGEGCETEVVFGDRKQIGKEIGLGYGGRIFYARCEYYDTDMSPDVRLVVVEGEGVGAPHIEVVSAADKNEWMIFAKGNPTGKMRELIIPLGLTGLPPKGVCVESERALNDVKIIAKWAAKIISDNRDRITQKIEL